jgi:hypothetical protein
MFGAEDQVNVELRKRLRHGGTPISPFQGWRQNFGVI